MSPEVHKPFLIIITNKGTPFSSDSDNYIESYPSLKSTSSSKIKFTPSVDVNDVCDFIIGN